MPRRHPRAPQPPREAPARAPHKNAEPATQPRPKPPARQPSGGRRDAPSALGRMGATETWLHGRHPVEAALANPARRLRRLLATAEAAGALPPALLARRGAAPEIVGRADLDAFLPPGAVHQGLALHVEALPALGPDDLVRIAESRPTEAGPAVIVALDQVTDPHNVGAILRSAAAFGALAVMVPDRHSPDETGTLAKSASGALERVPLVRVTNLARALDRLRAGGFWTAGLAADAPAAIGRADLGPRVVLVMGSEGQGLRRLTRDHCDHLVRLPMVAGAVESLNVSNAAAVALYALTHTALEGTLT